MVQSYRPAFLEILGDEPLLTPIDQRMHSLLKLLTDNASKRKLRDEIRAITKLFSDGIQMPVTRAYWSSAPEKSPAGLDEEVYARLAKGDGALAESYRQVVDDLGEDRLSYRGTAGELREVLSGVLHRLAPNDEVEATDWYKAARKSGARKEPHPTRAERTRYILRKRATSSETAEAYVENVEERLAVVVNATYATGSAQTHSRAEAEEVAQQLRYVNALLRDLLPRE